MMFFERMLCKIDPMIRNLAGAAASTLPQTPQTAAGTVNNVEMAAEQLWSFAPWIPLGGGLLLLYLMTRK